MGSRAHLYHVSRRKDCIATRVIASVGADFIHFLSAENTNLTSLNQLRLFSWRYKANMVFQCTAALITLAAIEPEKLVFFYTQLLGQEPKPYIPNVYAEFQLAGLRLGIFKPKQTNQSEFENTVKSGMSLCLEVNDLSGAINHLNALGYPPPGKKS